jgi:hypothetical protein
MITSTPIFQNLSLHNNIGQTNDQFDGNTIESPSASDSYLSDYYLTGAGDDQDVRVYATNNSLSINNEGYFDIPSMSGIDTTYLTQGDFNFTFQNNFTTSYVLEDESALNAVSFIRFKYNINAGRSALTLNKGTNSTSLSLSNLNDNRDTTFVRLHGQNGIINLTCRADFTSTFFQSTVPSFTLNFQRSFILGILQTLRYSISRNTYLTIRMYDNVNSQWVNLTTPIFLNSSLGIQTLTRHLINENLRYIDTLNRDYIQLFFQRYDTLNYNITMYEYNVFATYGFDLPITYTNQVALEFDLKGESSTVNGFYAWIRTLNLTAALNAQLNITLYRANTTIARTQANLIANTMQPEYSEKIYSRIVKYNDYHGDNLFYFSFNNLFTSNLNLYNYFIVIYSNRSEIIHSLVTLPRETFGDPDKRVDQQLKTSTNGGTTWKNAVKQVTVAYTSEELDASSFALNVTRGYMPSDFIAATGDDVNIENIPINNQVITNPSSSSLTWGLGRWNNELTTFIENNTQHDFRVQLNWNASVIKGFKFNVTYYARGFWIEPGLTFYNVSYNTIPRWKIEFTFDSSHVNFDHWNFNEFWYVYPNYFDAHNLTNPSSVDVYNDTDKEQVVSDKPNYDKTVVNSSITQGQNGVYTLNLTTPNFIDEMHSYINFKGNYWETNGFMYGDNMTVSLDIVDSRNEAPSGGTANVVLFYPGNQTKYPGTERISSSYVIRDDALKYYFNNDTLLEVNQDVPLLGNYYLGFFWFNGSAIGCKTLKLYLESYDVQLDDLFYQPELNKNILSGIVSKVYDNYSILIATVNETTGQNTSGFFPINQTGLDQTYSIQISGEEIPILLKSFQQNESLLNPQEMVSYKLSLENLHELIDLNVKVNVKLVSLANEEWIIDEQTSSVKVLKLKGDPLGRDTQEFDITLQMPTLQSNEVWEGVNAPVRKGGAKSIVTIYIDDVVAGIYESPDYSLIINSTESEFEGYLISLKYDQEITGASILKPFERGACTYLPDKTRIMINIYDKNFVSSYNQFNHSFTLKLNSQFTGITLSPETPIEGKKFNLSSMLNTEFAVPIASQNVTLQYYDQGNWVNLSSQFSSLNGSLTFEIDSLELNREDSFLFKFVWLGTQYINQISQNFTVDLLIENMNVTLSIISNQLLLYRDSKGTIKIELSNSGDARLAVIGISISTNPNMPNRIVERDNLILSQFNPGTATHVIIELDIPAVSSLIITVDIMVQNTFTQENVTFQSIKSFQVFENSITTYLLSWLTVIMIGVIIVIWGLMYLFVKKTIRRIETPLEETTIKRPRKGRYLRVSEIPKEVEEEREIEEPAAPSKRKGLFKKAKPVEEDTKQKTDLDTLLKEEGIDKDKNSKQ